MMKASRHILELFPLTLPFPLSTLHCLLCHLSDKAFFELAEAPLLREHFITSIQAGEQERGQNGQCYRAPHSQAGYAPRRDGRPALVNILASLMEYITSLKVIAQTVFTPPYLSAIATLVLVQRARVPYSLEGSPVKMCEVWLGEFCAHTAYTTTPLHKSENTWQAVRLLSR